MFSTLENAWDRSARRGWSTLASFTVQAFGLSLLLAVPLVWVQGPPGLRWIPRWTVSLPAQPVTAQPRTFRSQATSFSNMMGAHVLQPRYIPRHAEVINDSDGPPPPIGFADSEGIPDPNAGVGGPYLNGPALPVLGPKPPVLPSHPLRISHWAEGNLIYRIQPEYPEIARQARVQGPVELRAIISKGGTIENLVVVSGHPVLAAAAIKAVRQWRYRPYLLNGEPVEVETEIRVNFMLGGN